MSTTSQVTDNSFHNFVDWCSGPTAQVRRVRCARRRAQPFLSHRYAAASVEDLVAGDRPWEGESVRRLGDKHDLFLAHWITSRGRAGPRSRDLRAPGRSAYDRLIRHIRRQAASVAADKARRGCMMSKSAAELAADDDEVARTVERRLPRGAASSSTASGRHNAKDPSTPNRTRWRWPRRCWHFSVASRRWARRHQARAHQGRRRGDHRDDPGRLNQAGIDSGATVLDIIDQTVQNQRKRHHNGTSHRQDSSHHRRHDGYRAGHRETIRGAGRAHVYHRAPAGRTRHRREGTRRSGHRRPGRRQQVRRP